MKKQFGRCLCVLLTLGLMLSALPIGALAAESAGTVTVKKYDPEDLFDYNGLIAFSDFDVTATIINDAKKKSINWTKANFEHEGQSVWQANGGRSGSYSALAIQVDKPCYIVYDYLLVSKSSSTLKHLTAPKLTGSGISKYSSIPNNNRHNISTDEIPAEQWDTAVIDLTDFNTENRVLWLEYYGSKSDANEAAQAYVSNLRLYQTLETLPQEYQATVSIDFNTEHGYVDYTHPNNGTTDAPVTLKVPIWTKFNALRFRANQGVSVLGWTITDAQGEVVKEDSDYSIVSFTVEKPQAYIAKVESVLFASGPEKIEAFTWSSEANDWELATDEIGDFDGYWFSQTYGLDKDLKWRVKITKGSGAYESVLLTDNGEPKELDVNGCYELTPGDIQHNLELTFRQEGCTDLVRLFLIWPTLLPEEAWELPASVTVGPQLPLELYWGSQFPWQYYPELSTPERPVFKTTCSEKVDMCFPYLNITSTETGILCFDYLVDGSERSDLRGYFEDDSYNYLIDVSGKKGWTHLEIPFEVHRSAPDEAGRSFQLEYSNWDARPEEYAAIANLSFQTGPATVKLNSFSHGTVQGIAPGETVCSIGETKTLIAKPDEGYRFLGWVDENNNLLSMADTYSFVVRENRSITPLFIDPSNLVAQAGNQCFDDLQTALDSLQETGGVVRLLQDVILSGDLSVPAGVTLLLPCSEGDVGYDPLTGYNPDGTAKSPNKGAMVDLYRTLTVPEGITLTVEGTVLVNAVTGRPAAGHYDMDVNGGCSKILLEGDLQVKSGGLLDVCGYVEGTGTVTAFPGGEVRDLYVVRHWRGGSQAFNVFPEVYPMNETDMHNITAKTVIQSGAKLVGTVKMYASDGYYYTRFPQIDNENGLIRMKSGGYVEKTYENGRTMLRLYGGGQVASSTLNIVGMDLSTAGFLYPVDGDMDIELVTGDYTITERLKFMPGATVTVDGGTSLSIAEKTSGQEANQVVFYENFQPVDPDNTSDTEYPAGRGPAQLILKDGAKLTLSGALAGQVLAESENVTAYQGKNAVFQVKTLEANGYCNGTRELSFQLTEEAEPLNWRNIPTPQDDEPVVSPPITIHKIDPANGTVTETTTKPDGTVVTVETRTDGVSVETSEKNGTVESTVTVPDSLEGVRVTIPVKTPTTGMVAVLVYPDGTEELVKTSAVTGQGVTLRLNSSAKLKIIDNSQDFEDLQEDGWYRQAIDFVTARELFGGVTEREFQPDLTMSRGMLAMVLYRLNGEPVVPSAEAFPDVDEEAWYAEAVAWASEQKLVSGYDSGLFGADNAVTREQLAAILYRLCGTPDTENAVLAFGDGNQVSAWAWDAVNWAVSQGLLSGRSETSLAPGATVTRAEVAAILQRLIILLA